VSRACCFWLRLLDADALDLAEERAGDVEPASATALPGSFKSFASTAPHGSSMRE